MEWRTNTAIYLQVIELFKKDIILQKYKPKDKAPSVREYALKLNVNPNTIVKAYDVLAKERLIEVRSTNGYYITDNLEVLKQLKPFFAEMFCREFLNQMESIGYSKNESISMLKERD